MIYFCEPRDCAILKMRLGYSKVVDQRLITHDLAELNLIAVMQGSREYEQRLHRHFASDAAPGRSESFYLGERIWQYVERLLLNGYASASVDDVAHMASPPWSVISPISRALLEEDGQAQLFSLGVKARVDKASKTALYQSANDEWYTPAAIIESARSVLGAIDLDPASCPVANRIVQAEHYYSARVDGLLASHPWQGRVWMNPPFGGRAQDFASRLAREFRSGNVTEAIALYSSGAMTCLWFDPMWECATAWCISRGRPRFSAGDKAQEANGSPSNGVVICYLGSRAQSFAAAFAAHGPCVARIQ